MSATKKKVRDLSGLVELAMSIKDKGTGPAIYLGPTVVQAQGAWTRCGPTWIVPGIGWVVFGPGVHVWRTTEGLAQLAEDLAVEPTWHAIGVAVAAHNISFAMLDAVARHHEPVAACLAAVEAVEAEVQS